MSKKPASALTLYQSEGMRKSVNALSTAQILRIMQKTPSEHVYQRPGKGGQTWDYVTGTYVKKVLNYVFAWNWDFNIVQHGVEGDIVWVLGRLTVRVPMGQSNFQSIVKEQFGRAEVKKLKTGGNVDFGNDLKAASTDALKKCASELGIASDVYGKEEFKEIETASAEVETKTVKPQSDDGQPIKDEQKETIRAMEKKNGVEPPVDVTDWTRGQARVYIDSLSKGVSL